MVPLKRALVVDGFRLSRSTASTQTARVQDEKGAEENALRRKEGEVEPMEDLDDGTSGRC